MKRHQRGGAPGQEYDDDLLNGLWPAIAIGVVVAAVGLLIVWGLKVLMALAALAFFGWLARWAIRIF